MVTDLTDKQGGRDPISEIPPELPVIPINDGVVFPYMLVPLVLTDSDLIGVVDEALASSKTVGAFTQKDPGESSPGPGGIYHTGCAVLIQKMARFPDGHIRIIGQGLARIAVTSFTGETPFMRVAVDVLKEPEDVPDRTRALMMNVSSEFGKLVDASESYQDELKSLISTIREPGRLADLIAANLNIENSEKQKALEFLDPHRRLEFTYELVGNELEIAKIGEKIRQDVRQEMDREQKDYYLRQQIKAMRKELGDEDTAVELEELRERIESADLTEQASEAAMKEWNRLSRMSPNSSEYIVARTYIDWLLDIPWKDSTSDRLDISQAAKVLDRDHYDLDQVKDRILDYLSVRKLKKDLKGSILCFTGPPGVGKTSLGRSIAAAMGRKFVRISLGGVRDEADIRGHRRTYIGALPGRIIQGIVNAGSNNPVFMLDEIDKLGMDYRGDPSSALLEVLDPQQNDSFEDHYVNLPFDLSRVMFITTANVRENIPSPLLDRMEVLELPGYITAEKMEIARRYLVPRQLEENGVSPSRLRIKDEALRAMIERYTSEAGVRELERKIGSVARKAARRLVSGGRGPYTVSRRNLTRYLGSRHVVPREKLAKPEIGVATGLAKTGTGGTILFIEALAMKGSGRLRMTGKLGEVMKESAQAAVSFVRSSYLDELDDRDFFEKNDIHLHVPEGAVPKDGPSAGVAIAASIASIATGKKVRDDVAMTGEITLTGKVLQVGAIRDKVLAAHRAGIYDVILPSSNRSDIEEIPERERKSMKFVFIDRVEQGVNSSLVHPGKKKGKK